MAIKTNIQWCDSTVNPIMGCGGCELYPKPGDLLKAVDAELHSTIDRWRNGKSRQIFRALIDNAWKKLIKALGEPLPGHTNKMTTTNIWHLREQFADQVAKEFGRVKSVAQLAVEKQITCYAAKLHLNRARSIVNFKRKANKGYAANFEILTRYPGRIAEMAKKPDLFRKKRSPSGSQKRPQTWLNGLPRLIFLSDMGDAVTRKADFPFLQQELEATQSEHGKKHIWLWLTKRPDRLQEYAELVGGLPLNFCAMTTITSPETLHRVNDLRGVAAACRGLSIEPLWSDVADQLDLSGIDWVIVGGESGKKGVARPFHVEWAINLKQKCKEHGVAFFVKQLGRDPVRHGKSLSLKDHHGGNWKEWDKALRVREFPDHFLTYRKTQRVA